MRAANFFTTGVRVAVVAELRFFAELFFGADVRDGALFFAAILRVVVVFFFGVLRVAARIVIFPLWCRPTACRRGCEIPDV